MKRALLIGINYFNTPSELNGCHNDVDDMCRLLVEVFKYDISNIHVMKDSKDDPEHKRATAPTRRNILANMRQMVQSCKPKDELFIHYSGHGTWTYDLNNDERDGKDELICPVDDTLICDDELNDILVQQLPKGAKLRCLFDCCHSGTILDLPCRWRYLSRSYKENPNPKIVAKDCIMLSGCRDKQTSADAWIDGEYAGAMTWAFVSSICELLSQKKKDLHDISWKDIVYNIRYRLKRDGYSQVPQLSFCNKRQLRNSVDL